MRKIINIKIWDVQQMPGCKLGQRTWEGGSAVKGEKRKKNPCLCRTTSVLSGPKSDVTSGSI